MKSRYLLSAGAALAVAFGCAEANAQFAFLGGPYPVTFYVGPEGGWTSLNNHTDSVAAPPFIVNGVGVPATNSFQGKYDSGSGAIPTSAPSGENGRYNPTPMMTMVNRITGVAARL